MASYTYNKIVSLSQPTTTATITNRLFSITYLFNKYQYSGKFLTLSYQMFQIPSIISNIIKQISYLFSKSNSSVSKNRFRM